MNTIFWKTRTFLISVIVLGVGLGIFLLLLFIKPSPPALQNDTQATLIKVQEIKLGQQVPQLLLYGKVESPRQSKLEAAVDAFVEKTPVLEGQYVKAGQLIVKLDDQDARIAHQERLAEVNDLRAQLFAESKRYASDKEALAHEERLHALVKKEVERQQTLAEKHYISASDVDRILQDLRNKSLVLTKRRLDIENYQHRIAQLEAKLAKAKAQLEQAEVDLSRTKILAPFDGRVTRLFVSKGDRVNEGETIVEMYDTSHVEVRLQIPQRYVLSVEKAIKEKKTITAVTYKENETIHFKLDRLGGIVEEGRGTVDAYFLLTKRFPLTLGLTMPIIIDLLPVQNAAAVPSEAVYGNRRIYKVVNQHLQGVFIENLGVRYLSEDKQLVIVRSDQLKTGDVVLVTNLPNAITGLKVKPIHEKRTD